MLVNRTPPASPIRRDRLILQHYRDSTDVGIYNLAYQVATILLVLIVAANQGTIVEFGRAIHDTAARAAMRQVVTLQYAATVALAAVLALLGPVGVALLLPPSYLAAAGYIGWLVLGTLLFCLSLVPMYALTIYAGKTRWVWTAATHKKMCRKSRDVSPDGRSSRRAERAPRRRQ